MVEPTIQNLRREHLEQALGLSPVEGGKYSYNDLVFKYATRQSKDPTSFPSSSVEGINPSDIGLFFSEALNVRTRGVTGNGITDDTATLQSTLDYAAANSLAVYLPPGKYKITSTLNIPSNTHIIGAGRRQTILDVSGMGATLSSGKTAMQAIGTIDSFSYGLTADIVKGAKEAFISNAILYFSVGDSVLLSSSAAFHASDTLKQGEIKKIEAVNAESIVFEDAAYDTYLASNSAKVQKLTKVVKNITLEKFTLQGTDVDNMERGFFCHVGENIVVRDCEFNYLDWNSINFRAVVNFQVHNNIFRNVHWVSNTPNYYGLVAENSTAHGQFTNNHGTKCRHLFTTGYVQAEPGVTRFILVQGNVDTYSQSASYDTHDASEYINIVGNTSSFSEAWGISTEGRETTIADNHIVNSTSYGINVVGASENIIVANNRITSDISLTAGIWVGKSANKTFRPRSITITGNIITVPVANHGIYIVSSDDITFANNSINRVQNSYAIRVHDSVKSRFIGNSSAGGSAFIFLQDCVGSIVANNTCGANDYVLRTAETVVGKQRDTLIMGNDTTETIYKIANPLGSRKIVGNLGMDDAVVA